MKFTFKYDDIANVLLVKSDVMERLPKHKIEIKRTETMNKLFLDKWTKEVIGASIYGFTGFLKANIKKQPKQEFSSVGDDKLNCSFCGKNYKQVKNLIAGPTTYICDQCVSLINEILMEKGTFSITYRQH